MTTLASSIAQLIQARNNCRSDEWKAKHSHALDFVMGSLMPSGSGIDSGTKLDPDSTPDKLVFIVDFHVMDENGYYDGWLEFKVTVRASLAQGFEMKISGRDRNGIKEMLQEVYHHALSQEYSVYKIYEESAE